MRLRRQIVQQLVLAGLACFCGWSAPDEALPKAEEILDKFAEVTGGKAAYESVHNEKLTGNFEFLGKGIKGTVTMLRAEPNKALTSVDLEGVGKLEDGTDGKTAWQNSSMQGPRVKEGEERAAALREATLRAPLYWRKLYKHVETAGQEKVGDQECYKVVLTPEEGKPETQYYDKKTGLLVKMNMVMASPMGEIPTETILGDYQEQNGLREPRRVQQKAAGLDFLITLDRVEYNVDIPANKFDVPADVKAVAPK